MQIFITHYIESWYCFQLICLSVYVYMFVDEPKSGSADTSYSVATSEM